MGQGFTALGRLHKTIFILRYVSDPDLRRAIHRQLNRGEFRHRLANRLHFGNQGEFATGDYEETMNKASCLSLLSNAVLIWNTLELDRIVTRLRDQGHQVRDEDLARISPLMHRHVIPNGTYHFRNARDQA